MALSDTGNGANGPGIETRGGPCWLVWASLGYLALPVLVFLLGWLQPGWAILAVACAVITTVTLARGESGSRMPLGWRWWQGLVMTSVIGLLISTQGAGGFGIQNWDWFKHLAILRDLMDHPWPVIYHTTKDTVSLTYYVAYYLPAALVGHAFGWTAANVALWLWTILGCVLAGFWLGALSRARWWMVLLVLLLFSGCDIIGGWSRPVTAGFPTWMENFDLEWWSKYWVFPSNLTLIAYVPHQGIAGWLLTALLIDGLRRHTETYHASGLLVLSMLWSPFLTIGLALVYAGWLAWYRPSWKSWLMAQCTWRSVPTLFLGLLLVLYFSSKFVPYELPPEFYSSRKIMAKGNFSFVPGIVPRGEFAVRYVLTLLLEFGLLALFVFKGLHRKSRCDIALLMSACLCLAGLPWVHYGHFNDLVMRACIPALFILQVLSLQALSTPATLPEDHGKKWARLTLGALLVIGALYPLNMLRITCKRLEERTWHVYYLSDYKKHPDLFRQQRDGRRLLYSIGQYMGASDSFFFRHLARSAPATKTATDKIPAPAP